MSPRGQIEGGGDKEMIGGLLDQQALLRHNKGCLKENIGDYNAVENDRGTTSAVGDVVTISN